MSKQRHENEVDENKQIPPLLWQGRSKWIAVEEESLDNHRYMVQQVSCRASASNFIGATNRFGMKQVTTMQAANGNNKTIDLLKAFGA